MEVGGGAARLFLHLCLNDRFMLPSLRLYGGEHAPSGLEAVSNQARFLLLLLFFFLVGYDGDGLVVSRLNFEGEVRASEVCSLS